MSACGLPRDYKFVVLNETGVEIAVGAIDLSVRQAKYSSTGVLTFGGSAVTRTNASALADDADVTLGAVFDNSTDLYLGFDGILSVVTTGSPAGDVSIWLVGSPDGGTTYPDDQEGILLGVINFSAAATKVIQIAF